MVAVLFGLMLLWVYAAAVTLLSELTHLLRRSPFRALLHRFLRRGEVERRIHQSDVRKGLRKIPQLLARHGIVLLTQQSDVVA